MSQRYTMSQLQGMDRCLFRRQNDRPAVEEKNTTIVREAVIKKCIYGYLTRNMSEKDVKDVIFAEAYAEDENMADVTKQILAYDLYSCIMRYVKSERRIPQLADESELDIFNISVRVKPDVFYFDGSTLEIVKFCYKKPDLTQNGRKLDGSAMNSLPLYSLLFYGKQLNAYINPQQKQITVKASFYYLRKANDSYEKEVFDLDFFETKNGKNVISIQDTCQFPSNMDERFYQLFQEFKTGQNTMCSADNCKYCHLYSVCSYHAVPQPIVKESLTASAKGVSYTNDQLAAIQFERGIARINAGAGAGKTMVISQRVVELLKKGYKPEEICVLSFTNAAAAEMTERIKRYWEVSGNNAGVDLSKLISMTFNSLGDDIISKTYHMLGFSGKPILLEEGEKSRIIETLLIENLVEGLNYRNMRINETYIKGAVPIAKRMFDIFKNYRMKEVESDKALEFLERKMDADWKNVSIPIVKQLFGLFGEYERRLKEENYIEYSDQEWLLFDLWNVCPNYFRNTGIKHVIVDEYQDSNERQMNIIKMLCNSNVFTSLMVVGDDSQAIYSFRDTSPKYIIDFFELLGCSGTDFFLLNNFRSVPEIINFANEINKRNKNRIPKNLVATKPSIGTRPVVQAYLNRDMEYAAIVQGVKAQLANGRKPEDMAFIARTKSELLKMKDLLEREDIPCVMLNPELTKENPKVQACMALYSFLTHPEDESSMVVYLNCLCDGKFHEMPKAKQDEYVNAYVVYADEFAKQEDNCKLQMFAQLALMLKRDEDEVYGHFLEILAHHKTWRAVSNYMVNFDIYGDNDSFAKKLNYPGMVLTTAHSSKGLEWKVVFNSITRYDNKVIRAASREDELEEVRRLLFVSVTRAQEELYISGLYWSFGTAIERNFNIFLQDCYEIAGKSLGMEYIDRYESKR